MKISINLALITLSALTFATVDLKPADTEDAVTFTIKNFGINANGSIKGLKGTIKWDAADASKSMFSVSVDVNTINTGIDDRDNHLRKEEYFNVAKFPAITFNSNQITVAANNTYNANGSLTIKGVTKNITIPFTVTSAANGYMFESNFTINRLNFGVGRNSMVLGDDVKVKLKVNAAP